MAKSVDILSRLMNNLKTTIPVCDPEAISQLVDTGTQIERAFFRHDIGEKEREKYYKKLYESIADFRSRCPCR